MIPYDILILMREYNNKEDYALLYETFKPYEKWLYSYCKEFGTWETDIVINSLLKKHKLLKIKEIIK